MRMLHVLTFFLALLAVTESRAEAYSYVDKGGEMHFVDSLHAVPPEYRSQVENLDAEAEAARETPTGQLKEQRMLMSRLLIDGINDLRRQQGRAVLSHAEKREVNAMLRSSIPVLIVSHMVLLVVWLAVIVHGFMNGHPLWSIANLVLLGLPVPVYCVLHVGDDSRALKWCVSAASVVPLVALVKTTWDFYSLTARLVGVS